MDMKEQLRPLIDDLGQSEVARRSGVAQPWLSAWLGGRRDMPIERQVQIAEALGFEVRVRLVRSRSRVSANGTTRTPQEADGAGEARG